VKIIHKKHVTTNKKMWIISIKLSSAVRLSVHGPACKHQAKRLGT